MAVINKALQKVMEQTTFAAAGNLLYGNYNGYKLIVGMEGNVYFITTDATAPIPIDFNEYRKEFNQHKILNAAVNGSTIYVRIKGALTANKIGDNIMEALNHLTEFLRHHSYHNCCCVCGRNVDCGIYYLNGMYHLICHDDVEATLQKAGRDRQQYEEQKENIPGGILGALIGSLIGAALIVIIGQLGFISLYSGILMGMATVYGYKRLGNKFSVNGIIVCVVLIIVATYLAVRVDWAILIAKSLKWSFGESFRYVDEVVEASGNKSGYMHDLIITMLMCGASAAVSIFTSFSSEKQKFSVITIQNAPELYQEAAEEIAEGE